MLASLGKPPFINTKMLAQLWSGAKGEAEHHSETQTSVFGIYLAHMLPKRSPCLLWTEAKSSATNFKNWGVLKIRSLATIFNLCLFKPGFFWITTFQAVVHEDRTWHVTGNWETGTTVGKWRPKWELVTHTARAETELICNDWMQWHAFLEFIFSPKIWTLFKEVSQCCGFWNCLENLNWG